MAQPDKRDDPSPTAPAASSASVTEQRDQTDESLAEERAKSDAAQTIQAHAQTRADAVVERAREKADDVLSEARAHADAKQPAPGEQSSRAVAKDRRREDAKVGGERAAADEALRVERIASARALARLLPLERRKTDRDLLTERARSDGALAHRDDFLGMVSHDLRGLLQVIVLNAETMITNAQGELGLSEAQSIQRSAGRMGRLIGDLVDVTSIDAGKLAIARAPGDAAAVIREAIETWGPPAATRGMTLEAAVSAAITANFDHERVHQILGNLISNALKFSARGARILVGAERSGAETRFFVKDTGPGISPAQHESIFERFWQVGKNDRRGLGLGLYISRCLAEAHGGRIWVESTPGAGSTFCFTVSGEG